jgi:hypothetical protein
VDNFRAAEPCTAKPRTIESRTIEKYTGVVIARVDLAQAAAGGGWRAALATELGDAIWTGADAIGHLEDELDLHVAWINATTDRVNTAITAGPGQCVPTLNPLGELQSYGPRFDQLIAVRAERIAHLRQLVRLWSALPTLVPVAGAQPQPST